MPQGRLTHHPQNVIKLRLVLALAPSLAGASPAVSRGNSDRRQGEFTPILVGASCRWNETKSDARPAPKSAWPNKCGSQRPFQTLAQLDSGIAGASHRRMCHSERPDRVGREESQPSQFKDCASIEFLLSCRADGKCFQGLLNRSANQQG